MMMTQKRNVRRSQSIDHQSAHAVLFAYIHTHFTVVPPFALAHEEESHLSRWQLSIQPQGRWRDGRKPLSSSHWLSLNLCLSLCTLPLLLIFSTAPSRVYKILSLLSETLLQALFLQPTHWHIFCFPLPHNFSPVTFHSRGSLWMRCITPLGEGVNRQHKMDLGLRGAQVLAPCSPEQISGQLSSDANSPPTSTCWMFWLRT